MGTVPPILESIVAMATLNSEPSLNQIRGDLQLSGLQPSEKQNRVTPRTKLRKTVDPKSENSRLLSPSKSEGMLTASGNPIVLRCSFTELNELALRFEGEIEIEELLMKKFDVSSTNSW